MSTTARRVFNQAYLYSQTGSSGIHSHKHKHIQLFSCLFSSSLRDTDDIKRRTFLLRRFLICVWRLKMRTRHSRKPKQGYSLTTGGVYSAHGLQYISTLCPSFKSYVCVRNTRTPLPALLSFPPPLSQNKAANSLLTLCKYIFIYIYSLSVYLSSINRNQST